MAIGLVSPLASSCIRAGLAMGVITSYALRVHVVMRGWPIDTGPFRVAVPPSRRG